MTQSGFRHRGAWGLVVVIATGLGWWSVQSPQTGGSPAPQPVVGASPASPAVSWEPLPPVVPEAPPAAALEEPAPEPVPPAVDLPPGLTVVRGWVVGELPEGARVGVGGCGRFQMLWLGERAFEIVVRQPGRCTLQAWKMEGLLRRPGPDVEIVAGQGEVTGITLELPEGSAAGFGFQFEMEAEGARVKRVYPDTPAADADLVQGDLLVAVDGIDVAGLPQNDFLDVSLGEPGTEAELEVVGEDGEAWVLNVVRERLEAR